METQLVKINFKSLNLTFSQREKFINEEILKYIENFKLNGLIVRKYEILSKNASFFSVKFELVKI